MNTGNSIRVLNDFVKLRKKRSFHTGDLVAILVAHKVQQAMNQIHEDSLAFPLLVIQANVDVG